MRIQSTNISETLSTLYSLFQEGIPLLHKKTLSSSKEVFNNFLMTDPYCIQFTYPDKRGEEQWLTEEKRKIG